LYVNDTAGLAGWRPASRPRVRTFAVGTGHLSLPYDAIADELLELARV
jgi:hypothetical protein